MAKHPLWNDEYRILLLAIYLQKPVGVKSPHSRQLVELALQLSDILWLMADKGICVGKPRDLAADGSVARFFARQGVEFCPDTLTFHIRR